MAAPFAAGSAALLLQARGKAESTALGLRDLLQTTAGSVGSSHTDGALLQTAAQQGAGLINVFAALNAKTIVTPGQLALNDSAFFQGQSVVIVYVLDEVNKYLRQVIQIKNTGDTEKVYKLTHTRAGTVDSIAANVCI